MGRKLNVEFIKRNNEKFYFYGGTDNKKILERDGKKAQQKGFKYRIIKKGIFPILFINNPKLKNSKNPKKTMGF